MTMKRRIDNGAAEPLGKQENTKEKLFLLTWQDLDSNTRSIIYELVIALFTGAIMDPLYYDLEKARPWLELRITKSKVYRFLRFILEITPRAVYNKLSGRADFTLSEMLRIMAALEINSLDTTNYLLDDIKKGFSINE